MATLNLLETLEPMHLALSFGTEADFDIKTDFVYTASGSTFSFAA